MEPKFESNWEISQDDHKKKMILEKQLKSLQKASRIKNINTKVRSNVKTTQGDDIIKQEVVLRLRLANDTMLLIKEK